MNLKMVFAGGTPASGVRKTAHTCREETAAEAIVEPTVELQPLPIEEPEQTEPEIEAEAEPAVDPSEPA